MRISIVTLTAIITLLAINSDAAEVLRAYDHAAQCGTYEYYAHTKALQMGEFYDETDFKTSLHLVSPLEKNRLGKKTVEKEYQQTEAFLRKWVSFFEKNGDTVLSGKTFCHALYDDVGSIGVGNTAYGNNTLLIGESFLQNLTRKHKKELHLKEVPASTREMVYLHDFAHLLQRQHQLYFELNMINHSRSDLHADCTAGFLHWLGRYHAQEKNHGFESYFYTLQTKEFATREHHSFTDARAEAFTAGQHIARGFVNDYYFEDGKKPGFRHEGKVFTAHNITSALVVQQCYQYYN